MARGIKYGTVAAASWPYKIDEDERFVYVNGRLSDVDWINAVCDGITELCYDNVTVLNPHAPARNRRSG